MSANERLYTVSDAAMLLRAETVNASLPEDIADFTAIDTTLDETYPTTISSALSNVLAIKTDQVIIDEQAQLTENLLAKSKECSTGYRTIAYFARKAFPDSPAVQNQFGLNDYEKARDNQAQMILFMESMAATAQRYSAELIAEGCSQATIDNIAALATGLKAANTAQEKFKKDRGVITQERVIKLNELYKLLTPISEVAQIIYADNPAMLAKYVLS